MIKERLSILRNYEKPKGYRYYNYFLTRKGDYLIWSRDGKRFYLDGTRKSQLMLLPDTPFKSITEAKDYLRKRVAMKGNFPSYSKKLRKVC